MVNRPEGGEGVVEGSPRRERAVFDELSAQGEVRLEESGGEEMSVELLDLGEAGATLDQQV